MPDLNETRTKQFQSLQQIYFDFEAFEKSQLCNITKDKKIENFGNKDNLKPLSDTPPAQSPKVNNKQLRHTLRSKIMKDLEEKRRRARQNNSKRLITIEEFPAQ